MPARVVGEPFAVTPPGPSTTVRASGGDALSEERAFIARAQHELDADAYGQALAALQAHERRFPRGALAGAREWLKKRVEQRARAGAQRAAAE